MLWAAILGLDEFINLLHENDGRVSPSDRESAKAYGNPETAALLKRLACESGACDSDDPWSPERPDWDHFGEWGKRPSWDFG